MRKTKYNNLDDVFMINTEQMMKKLNCGYRTATIIGEEAKARIYIGRRVWYNVTKVEKYLEKIAV
jgi:hypothetical protein